MVMNILSGDEQTFSTVKKCMLELQGWTHGLDLVMTPFWWPVSLNKVYHSYEVFVGVIPDA